MLLFIGSPDDAKDEAMATLISTLELRGSDNYSIYMRHGGDQLICHVEVAAGVPNNWARFMRELSSLGIATRRDDKTTKLCARTARLCDHSSCFGMAVTPLKTALPTVWEAANTLYGSPQVIRISTTGPEKPVIEWAPGKLSHHFAHRDPAKYLPALKQLRAFKSVQLQAGNRVDMTLAPDVTLDNALQEAHRVLAAH